MIEKQVTDKIVTFDGSMEAVKDICDILKNQKYDKYNIEFGDMSPNGIFAYCTLYRYWASGQLRSEQKASSSSFDDHDSVVFHADGTINVVEKLPKCYEDESKE